MKKLLAIFALAVAMTCNANAATEKNSGSDLMAAAQIQAVSAGVVMNTVDMQAAFQQDAQPLQMAALTSQEMRETEGAWGWKIFAIAIVKVWQVTTTSQKDKNTAQALLYFAGSNMKCNA